MGLDFDALEYCKSVKLKQPHPPYACPVRACDRSYKTVIGLQYHLVKYDHDNPQPLTPVLTPNRKKARARGGMQHLTPKDGRASGAEGGSSAGEDGRHGVVGGTSSRQQQYTNPEALVIYNESEETVQFNIHGKSVRLGIDDTLPLIDEDEFAALVERGCILNADAPPLEEHATWARVQVPEAKVRIIEDYNVPDAPPRPLAYYRFIEKSAEELDGEIEYDVDEEDSAWLEHMNEQRERAGHTPVSIDTMELLMDRLEKESFFQAAANGTPTGVEVDDDAVCCICLDGECQNTNVILFCDMCNLAVHQDCYGVPYIPEGQWLCRRCLQSPSKPVSCVLCPNTGGAFKQTDRGQWAHVVCALWIPEVRFANTVFLEPIDSIETIPAARWRLTCYVCKEKGLGACIQCHRNSCYAAFHVTCAQQAGLYMTMDTIKDGHNDSSMHVQKYAYCHAHTPPDAKLKTNQLDFEDTRHKMREARKALAKKRSTAPVVLIPTIPSERVQEIAGMVHMQRKKEFIERIIAYWTLKRHYRNGVPLLRRLQSQGGHHGVIHRSGIEGSPDTNELYRQLKYWQCLRQDLERARLLCELVRKREKLKAAYVKIYEQVVTMQLNPLESALSKMLDALETRDTTEIFREPVDTDEVPDYLDIVKQPMDLGTMRTKLSEGQYTNFEQMEADFDLMIQNCLAYNNKDTMFYRAGIRMRDQAAPLFVELRRELRREGLLDHLERDHVDHVELEVESELKLLLTAPASEAIVQKLLILADKSQVLKNPTYRTKKIKQIRMEISRMRKTLQKARVAARYSNANDGQFMPSDDDDDDIVMSAKKLSKLYTKPKRARKSFSASAMEVDDDDEAAAHHDDDEEEESNDDDDDDEDDDSLGEARTKGNSHTVQTPPCSPVKSLNNSTSPVGINRRTAILLTRKAQAALKRPSENASTLSTSSTTTPVKEEHQHNSLTANALSTTSSSTLTNAVASAVPLHTAVSLLAAGGTPPAPSSPNFTLTHNNNNNAANAAAATLASSALTINSKLSLNTLSASLVVNSNASHPKSPKRINARYRQRLSELRNSVSMSPKKSPNPNSNALTAVAAVVVAAAAAAAAAATTATATTTTTTTTPSLLSSADAHIFERIPDSFRVYRANNERDVSDSDDGTNSSDSSSPCSSCSDFSGSGSDCDSMDNDDDDVQSNLIANDTDEAEDSDDTDAAEDDDDSNNEEEKDENAQHKRGDDTHLGAGDRTADMTEQPRNNNNAGRNGQAMSCSGAEEESDSSTDEGETTTAATTTTTIAITAAALAKKRITRSTPIPQALDNSANQAANINTAALALTTTAATMMTSKRMNLLRTKQKNKKSNNLHKSLLSPATTPTPPPLVATTAAIAAAAPPPTVAAAAPPPPLPPPPLENTTTITAIQTIMSPQSNTISIMKQSQLQQQKHQQQQQQQQQQQDQQLLATTRASNKLSKLRPATPNAVNNLRRKLKAANAINNNKTTMDTQVHDGIKENNYIPKKTAMRHKPPLEPLQLVWAKCRGYPWYPALILDPKTPKGFVYNGVPLPAPPPDVLALRRNCIDDVVFLVLFFDAKRTWQWLPANKLEILGIDKQLDQQKLVESRKPAERKAVKRAYQDALLYQSQVSDLEGQGPDPIM